VVGEPHRSGRCSAAAAPRKRACSASELRRVDTLAAWTWSVIQLERSLACAEEENLRDGVGRSGDRQRAEGRCAGEPGAEH